MRTTEQKKAFEQYLIECINSEVYEVIAITNKQKLNFLMDTFKKEYVYPENVKRYGSEQNIFAEWIKGLPSSFGIDFANYQIIIKAKEFGFIPRNATEKQEDKALSLWWSSVAQTIFSMHRKANKLPRLTIADIKRLTSESSPYFFSSKTLRFFKQRVSDFKVVVQDEFNRYYIYAKHQHGLTERYFNPQTNELETVN